MSFLWISTLESALETFLLFFFIPLAFLTCQGVLCSVPGFLHETFLFQEALYISERNYVCAVITLYIDCYTHMIINISHVWCCGEMKVIALWLELFQRGEDWLAFPYWRLYREAGGTNSNSSYLCEKAISKCHFKIYFFFFRENFFSMVRFSFVCFFLFFFFFPFCLLIFLNKFRDLPGGKEKFELVGPVTWLF